MLKTTVIHGIANLLDLFSVGTVFVDGKNTILLGMCFADILKKYKTIVGSLCAVITHKPQIPSAAFVNQSHGQCRKKKEKMEYVAEFNIAELLKKT